MEGMYPALRELHKKILQGASLDNDSQTYASILSLQNSYPAQASTDLPVRCAGDVSPTWCQRDVTALRLSLIQMLITKAESSVTEPPTRCQYTRLVELLLQAGVDAATIQLAHTPDQVLSHLASKCLSCLVLFQLRCRNEVNEQWIHFCLKTLCKYTECQALISCLTSLLFVCKGIFRDHNLQRADALLQLLGPLHTVFTEFCSAILSQHSATHCQHPEPSIHLSCLLDLLEVLVALSTKLKLGLPFGQQVLTITLPQALSLISSPVSYFVKKQLILVLKRCLLYKTGEDLLCSVPSVSPLPDPLLDRDVATLAGALLSAVHQGWLLQVPVSDRSSSFGGATETSEPGPDLVILGAVSLSVLKALETQVLVAPISSDVTGKLQTFMNLLLVFLKLHLGSDQLMHPCEWVSLTFIEQDDDMLEVAKSLLKMYIQSHGLWFHPTSSHSCLEDGEGNWRGPSHKTGSDPHCIFLLLLKNVAFDASVLLDFLISSETCFLEYLVRYLKLLREDWPQFCLTCTLFDKSVTRHACRSESVCNSSCQGETWVVGDTASSLTNICTSLSVAAKTPSAVTKENTKHSAPSPSSGFEGQCSLGALQRLVAYDSSEDSESECTEEQTPVTAQSPGADSSDIDAQMGRLELRARCPVLQSMSRHADNTFPLGMRPKAARCLEELQEAICRLHRKKLFPYNPSALLKLLTCVSTLNRDTSAV
ncbi:protein Lines homolog 1 isoform 1-T2 [Discoglossus pictus]